MSGWKAVTRHRTQDAFAYFKESSCRAKAFWTGGGPLRFSPEAYPTLPTLTRAAIFKAEQQLGPPKCKAKSPLSSSGL